VFEGKTGIACGSLLGVLNKTTQVGVFAKGKGGELVGEKFNKSRSAVTKMEKAYEEAGRRLWKRLIN